MAKFYQSKLTEFKGDVDVLEHVYPHLMTRDGGKYFPTMDERLGDAECINCPKETEEYGHEKKEKYSRWMLLPEESVSRTQGGKPYIECLDCGFLTHL
jgi:hypothetical protein